VTKHPVARVYTEALLEIAKERRLVEETGTELAEVQELLEREPNAAKLLESPIVETPAKQAILKKALRGNVGDLTADFLGLLLDKGRFAALPSIVEAYRDMADEIAGRVRVHVETASRLPEGLRAEVRTAVARLLDREVVLEDSVEPALVGGAVITVGDKVYDGSLATRLGRARKQIMRSGGYEDQG
jgi:F-type H+-transporting ATPase subunit delta